MKYDTSASARAFWLESAGLGRILEEELAAPEQGWLRIEGECCGVSPGTERLVALGRVPAQAGAAMRCQYMAGEFSFPVKYGYSLVGRCMDGPPELRGRRIHVRHPHQDRCNVEASAVFPVPDGIPSNRATLASNLETAVSALWESQAKIGERACVAGFGIVGSLVARLFSRVPGTELLVIDTSAEKRKLAKSLGFSAAESCDPGVFDLAFECSGAPGGLQTALDAIGPEGRVVSLSWFGDREVTLQLGGAFHYGRKRILSSQVSTLPGEMLPRWNHTRRKDLVFRLLESAEFDRHITHIVDFEDLPHLFRDLCDGAYQGLAAVVRLRSNREE